MSVDLYLAVHAKADEEPLRCLESENEYTSVYNFGFKYKQRTVEAVVTSDRN